MCLLVMKRCSISVNNALAVHTVLISVKMRSGANSSIQRPISYYNIIIYGLIKSAANSMEWREFMFQIIKGH